VLPWFCLYLAATALGQRVALRRAALGEASVPRTLLAYAAIAFGLAAAWRLIAAALARLVPESAGLDAVLANAAPYQKLPPGFAYFTVQCGIGLLLLTGAFALEQRRFATRTLGLLAMIGQNALFVFLLQEHVYVSGLWLLAPGYSSAWPLLWLATVALIVAGTALWRRFAGTAYLTVGYGRRWGPKL
jgi:hypothetical protein